MTADSQAVGANALSRTALSSLRDEAGKPSSPSGLQSAFAIRARDLGDGPHRPFGSALQGVHGNDPLKAPELIGRTVKPRSAGPCGVCGERRFFCDCDDAQLERERGE